MRVFANPVGCCSLWFDNLATADGTPVPMGHAEGVVAISLAEVNPAALVATRRQALEEPYRAMFDDYPAALQRHYHDGPPPDWRLDLAQHCGSMIYTQDHCE